MITRDNVPDFMQSKEDKKADVQYFLYRIRYCHIDNKSERDLKTGRIVQVVAKTLADAQHWIEYRNNSKIFIEEYGMMGEVHTISGQIQDEITRSNAVRVKEFDEEKKKELKKKLKEGAIPKFIKGHTFKK